MMTFVGQDTGADMHGRSTATSGVRFTIVVPARNEADNLGDVVREIETVLGRESFELIVVDDGSSDGTTALLTELSRRHRFLRCLRHRKSCGKSAAISSGIRAARGALIATMDGDGQNDPRFLKPLLALAAEPGVGLAAGQRTRHAHSPVRHFASRLANRLRAWLLGDATRDTACGLKALRKDIFLQLPYFDNMHRFLPALVLHQGLAVRHLDVTDRPRLHGRSKYGLLDRALAGMLDLLGVVWLLHRRRNLPGLWEAPRRH